MEKNKYISKAVELHGSKYRYDLLPEEVNLKGKIWVVCDVHGPIEITARNHIGKNKSGCPICGRLRANNKMRDSIDDFIKKEKEVHGDKYEVIRESFISTSKTIKFRCKKCGNIFEQKGTMHLEGNGCNVCNPPHTKLTTESFKEKIAVTHPNLEILSEYKSTNKPITVRCKIHDYTYITTPHRLIQGANCQKCYDDRRGEAIKKPIDKLLEEINVIHGDRYELPNINEEYKSNKSKLTCICKKGHKFKITANKLLKGQGCHICNESHLERKISLILPNLKREYSSDWLRNPETKYHLSLDFYDEKMNIGIECQGDQHFRSYEVWGGKSAFLKNIKRDIIKNELCKMHETKLIYVIPRLYKNEIKKEKYKGIYNKNVYFIEDIEKDNSILTDLV